MRHCDHDISLLVPLLHILEGFRDSLQRVTSVDNRLECSSGGKVRDQPHSFLVSDGHAAGNLLSPGDGGPKGSNDVGQLHDVLKEDTLWFQRALAAVKRRRADDVEYQVVGLSILGESSLV